MPCSMAPWCTDRGWHGSPLAVTRACLLGARLFTPITKLNRGRRCKPACRPAGRAVRHAATVPAPLPCAHLSGLLRLLGRHAVAAVPAAAATLMGTALERQRLRRLW